MSLTSITGLPLHAVSSAQDPVSPASQTAQNREIVQAVQKVNASGVLDDSRELTITLDPVTKGIVVKLLDTTTLQVIDQIPSQYVLNIARFLAAEQAQRDLVQKSSL